MLEHTSNIELLKDEIEHSSNIDRNIKKGLDQNKYERKSMTLLA